MPRLPANASLIANFAEVQRAVQTIRALRHLKAVSIAGESSLQFTPESRNATLDLRSLSASGAPTSGAIPDASGHAGGALLTNGVSAYWSHPDTGLWLRRARAAGGTLASNSIALADAFAVALSAQNYSAKIIYLLPFLGANLAAALIPLRDTLAIGSAINSNFLNADFSQSTGLQGNGSTKILELLVKPNQLGVSNCGGMGYWETSINFSGSSVEPMGCYGVDPLNQFRYVLDLRSGLRRFCWGYSINHALQSAAAVNGHYYGQRSSPTLRELFLNGSSLATNTTSDSAIGSADRSIRLMGCDEGVAIVYWAGRCAVAYLTDGTLSAAETAAFHSLLQTYLIAPTGR